MSSLRKRLVVSSAALSSSSSTGAAKKRVKTTSTTRTTTSSSSSSPSPSSSSLMPSGWADFRRGDDATNRPGPTNVVIAKKTAPSPPKRRKDNDGRLQFPDFPEFQPNKSPLEVLEAGAFGGGYFRPIPSQAAIVDDSNKKNKKTQLLLQDQHLEFDFFSSLPNNLVCASDYDSSVNKYKVSCGGSLQMWQSKGWIALDCDPYGWFQWYCRFYNGRRCSDDARQVKRWMACTGPKGRWKRNLLNKIAQQQSKSLPSSLEAYNDPTISPVIRQTLLHWAYEITEKDLEEKLKEFK